MSNPMQYRIDKGFRSYDRWKSMAIKHGAKVRKTSTSKSHGEYWQAIHPQQGIVGFFLTGTKNGNLTILK